MHYNMERPALLPVPKKYRSKSTSGGRFFFVWEPELPLLDKVELQIVDPNRIAFLTAGLFERLDDAVFT